MQGGALRTVVLDDDPTGSQEATGVPVLLRRDYDDLLRLLRENSSVYVLTNSRALSETDAVALLSGLRDDIARVEEALGVSILVVQRGDSTLRGHVFAEVDVFARPDDIVVYVPAFPAGGRRTRDGVHEVLVDGAWTNAADTEFARDPVFGYRARTMIDYVRERGSRVAIRCTPASFARAAAEAPGGTVLVPDVETDADLEVIAEAIRALAGPGAERRIVVRSASPLAAYLAGRKSTGRVVVTGLDGRLGRGVGAESDGRAEGRPEGRPDAGLGRGSEWRPVLVVVGSHTHATTQQLTTLLERWPHLVEIETDAAIRDPDEAGAAAVRELRAGLAAHPLVVLSSERTRRPEHGTLEVAARVMSALCTAVAGVAELPAVVVAKGGITSAEIARTGLGAAVAWVEGQIDTGISLWRLGTEEVEMPAAGVGMPYVVVPGNMGDAGTLLRIAEGLV